MFASLLNPIIVVLSLSTTAGVVVHDTKIDKATAVAIAAPVAAVAYGAASGAAITSELHTHAERASISQSVKAFNADNPNAKPRTHDKKHLLQRHTARGQQLFDGFYMPLA